MKNVLRFCVWTQLIALVCFAFACYAQGLPGTIPEGDPTSSVLNLIMNGKNMSGIVLGGFIIICVTQFLKAPFMKGFFDKHPKEQQIILLLLGFLYSLTYNLSGVSSGFNLQTILGALVVSLGSTNFAQGFYELIKNFFKKEVPKVS